MCPDTWQSEIPAQIWDPFLIFLFAGFGPSAFWLNDNHSVLA